MPPKKKARRPRLFTHRKKRKASTYGGEAFNGETRPQGCLNKRGQKLCALNAAIIALHSCPEIRDRVEAIDSSTREADRVIDLLCEAFEVLSSSLEPVNNLRLAEAICESGLTSSPPAQPRPMHGLAFLLLSHLTRVTGVDHQEPLLSVFLTKLTCGECGIDIQVSFTATHAFQVGTGDYKPGSQVTTHELYLESILAHVPKVSEETCQYCGKKSVKGKIIDNAVPDNVWMFFYSSTSLSKCDIKVLLSFPCPRIPEDTFELREVTFHHPGSGTDDGHFTNVVNDDGKFFHVNDDTVTEIKDMNSKFSRINQRGMMHARLYHVAYHRTKVDRVPDE